MVRADIPTSSKVNSVKILNVEKKSKWFVVSFLVDQEIVEEKKALQEKQHTEFLFLKIDLKLYCDFFANND